MNKSIEAINKDRQMALNVFCFKPLESLRHVIGSGLPQDKDEELEEQNLDLKFQELTLQHQPKPLPFKEEEEEEEEEEKGVFQDERKPEKIKVERLKQAAAKGGWSRADRVRHQKSVEYIENFKKVNAKRLEKDESGNVTVKDMTNDERVSILKKIGTNFSRIDDVLKLFEPNS